MERDCSSKVLTAAFALLLVMYAWSVFIHIIKCRCCVYNFLIHPTHFFFIGCPELQFKFLVCLLIEFKYRFSVMTTGIALSGR